MPRCSRPRRRSCPAVRCSWSGDRLDTDIAGAAALGWDTALVLTGASTRADLAAATVRPTHVLATLAELPAVVGRDGVGARG